MININDCNIVTVHFSNNQFNVIREIKLIEYIEKLNNVIFNLSDKWKYILWKLNNMNKHDVDTKIIEQSTDEFNSFKY